MQVQRAMTWGICDAEFFPSVLFKNNNSAIQLETIRSIAVTPYNHIYFCLTVLELSDLDYFYKYTYTKVTKKVLLPSADWIIVNWVLKDTTQFGHDFSIILFLPESFSLVQEPNDFLSILKTMNLKKKSLKNHK